MAAPNLGKKFPSGSDGRPLAGVIDTALLNMIGLQHGVVARWQLRDELGWNASKILRRARARRLSGHHTIGPSPRLVTRDIHDALYGAPAPPRRTMLPQLDHRRSAPRIALDVDVADPSDHSGDDPTRLSPVGPPRSFVLVRRERQREARRRPDRGDTAADALRPRGHPPSLPLRPRRRGCVEPAFDHS